MKLEILNQIVSNWNHTKASTHVEKKAEYLYCHVLPWDQDQRKAHTKKLIFFENWPFLQKEKGDEKIVLESNA